VSGEVAKALKMYKKDHQVSSDSVKLNLQGPSNAMGCALLIVFDKAILQVCSDKVLLLEKTVDNEMFLVHSKVNDSCSW
jgi:hypothetical protein